MTEGVHAYKEQLDKFKENIGILKEFYKWIHDNKPIIESVLNEDKQRVSLKHIDAFYINLESRVENLDEAEQNIEEIKNNLKEENISDQYNNFLNKELLSINWSNYNWTSNNNYDRFNDFIESYSLDQQLSQKGYQFLDVLGSVIRDGGMYEHNLIGPNFAAHMINH